MDAELTAVSALELLALAVVAVLGSAAQSATGFGVALPVAPVAFALLAPPDAVLAVAAAGLMHNVLVIGTGRHRLAVRTADATLLVLAALPGLILGALIVSRVSKPAMQLAVGVAILVVVLLRVHEPGRVAALAGRGAALPIGALAGALTTTIGINGPPLVVWLRARGVAVVELRDTLAVVFLVLNLAAVASIAARGGAIPGVLVPALAIALAAGHAVGVGAHRQLSTAALDRALVAILAAAGGASIAAASVSLL